MQWISLLSRAQTGPDALAEILDRIDGAFDVALLFVTNHHTKQFANIASALSDAIDAPVVGCTGMGVIGESDEVEQRPGVSVLLGRLPNVEIRTAHVTSPQLPEDFLTGASGVIVIADTFSSPTEQLLEYIDRHAPDAAVFGGLASGGIFPGAHAFYDGSDVHHNGAVCVAFSGDLTIDTIVAQGCTPLGDPLTITRHSDKLIIEFDQGRPADVLTTILADHPGVLDNGLFVGLDMSNRTDGEYEPEDFLVRTFMGADPNSGAIALNMPVRDHQVVQFQVRDRKASSDDVVARLAKFSDQNVDPSGALLFTCIGRGHDLYGVDNHDTNAMKSIVGDVPVGGFFCNGEIGRVGGQSFIFGYTSSFAFFRPK